MSTTKVLLVDDDEQLVDIFCEYLQEEGFEVTALGDGDSAVTQALSGKYDIAILDIMIPGTNGIEVLKQIRANIQMPVLMLTAKGEETDRVVGLELGADDYVQKPCSAREVVARMRAILRRTQQGEDDDNANSCTTVAAGELVLWPTLRRAELRGKPLELTGTEFSLLEVLARNVGQVVSKSELSEKGLGRSLARYDRSIDVHLANIRRKFEVLGVNRDRIKTIYRRGYQMTRD